MFSYIKLKNIVKSKKKSMSWHDKSGAKFFEKNSKQLLKKYGIRCLNIIEIFCREKANKDFCNVLQVYY